jgi:maleate cis-trans isomerase
MYACNNGYRAKIGLRLPGTTTVVEKWFDRVAPEEVSLNSARMTTKAASARGPVNGGGGIGSAAQLADSQVDAIAHCCTAGRFSRRLVMLFPRVALCCIRYCISEEEIDTVRSLVHY